jgi:probable addiction module antidote protein
MASPTTRFDPASYLNTESQIAAYMNEVLEADDPALFAEALGTVARARGMAEIARQTKVSRESLYKSLSAQGNPEIKTISKVLSVLGYRLMVAPVKAKPVKRAKPAAAKTAKATGPKRATKTKAKAKALA